MRNPFASTPDVHPMDLGAVSAALASFLNGGEFDAFAQAVRHYGVIASPGGGPLGPHVFKVLARVGDPSEAAGEHAFVEIIAGDGFPSRHSKSKGTEYRTPIDVDSPWMTGLSPDDLEIALLAPHILDGRL